MGEFFFGLLIIIGGLAGIVFIGLFISHFQFFIGLFTSFFQFCVDGWTITWGILHGWVYLLILLGVMVVLFFIRRFINDKILETFTPYEKAKLDEASKKRNTEKAKYDNDIAILKTEHEKYVNHLISDKENEIENKNLATNSKISEINEFIAELESKIAKLEEEIENNTILHESDKSFEKISRLIDLMASNRADTIKEALLLDDEKMEALAERRRREYLDQQNARQLEAFRQEQLKLLREQNEIAERTAREQEEANKELIQQGKELERLEKKKLEKMQEYVYEKRNGLL